MLPIEMSTTLNFKKMAKEVSKLVKLQIKEELQIHLHQLDLH
jgi:hypothetical protein